MTRENGDETSGETIGLIERVISSPTKLIWDTVIRYKIKKEKEKICTFQKNLNPYRIIGYNQIAE